MFRGTRLSLAIAAAVAVCACRTTAKPGADAAGGDNKMKIDVTSSAFKEGATIPAKYTCGGQNISPPLAWSGAPKETNSFALICDDPDAPAGTWVHWVIFDIPANVNSLPEKVAKQEEIAGLGKNGKNTSQHFGYDGPCPPSGTHRYYFKLYALDTMLNLKAGLSKEELLSAMKNHVLAEAQIMGRYKR